jgi:uncharacterized protein YqeY
MQTIQTEIELIKNELGKNETIKTQVGTIKAEMVKAMKAKPKQTTRLNMLRFILSSLENEKVKLKLGTVEDLTAVDYNIVLLKELDVLEQEEKVFAEAGRDLENIIERKNILLEFAPKQFSKEELTVIVQEKINTLGITSIKEQGKLLGVLSKELKGIVFLGKLPSIIRTILN